MQLWYNQLMTKTQTQILTLIATLPLEERRELVEHMYDANMFGASFYDRMTPEQRTELEESIAQADRGEVVPSDQVFNQLAQKLGFSRA